jgi:anti-sigma regulatory factor (Ser/Thr protein kinase)
LEAELNIHRRLAPEPVSIARARQALEPLAEVVDPATIDTLRLLVSELVTNSVRHGGGEGLGEIELFASSTPGTIRVEVVDCGSGFDYAATDQAPGQESGWGLQLVAAFSDRWGISVGAPTRVWFEILDSGAFSHRARLGRALTGSGPRAGLKNPPRAMEAVLRATDK